MPQECICRPVPPPKPLKTTLPPTLQALLLHLPPLPPPPPFHHPGMHLARHPLEAFLLLARLPAIPQRLHAPITLGRSLGFQVPFQRLGRLLLMSEGETLVVVRRWEGTKGAARAVRVPCLAFFGKRGVRLEKGFCACWWGREGGREGRRMGV